MGLVKENVSTESTHEFCVFAKTRLQFFLCFSDNEEINNNT